MPAPRLHPSRRDYGPLTLLELARQVSLPEDFLAKLGVADMPGRGVAVPFYDAQGHHRADVEWSDWADFFGGGWPKTAPPLPYGLWQLPQARHSRLLFLVPAAADCWALWYHGLAALALPAVAGLERDHVQDVDTMVVPYGTPRSCPLFGSQVDTKLRQLAFAGSARSCRLVNGLEDFSLFHVSFPGDFREQLANALAEARPLRGNGPPTRIALPAFDPVPPLPIGLAPPPTSPQPSVSLFPAKRYTNIGILASDIRPMPLEWLWPDRIPRGRLTLLDGDPDQGKSLLAIDLAARLTQGRPMPDEGREMRGEGREKMQFSQPSSLASLPSPLPSAGVLFLVNEDNLHDTLRPRLEAAGADLGRVLILNRIPRQDRPPQLPHDLPFIRQAMERIEAQLVIVDPLAAFLGPNMVLGHESACRAVVQALARLAEETAAAILLLRHLAKAWRWNPLYRGAGSMALIAQCRSALWLAADPHDPRGRVLAVTKSNLAARPPSLALHLPAHAGEPLSWRGESPWSSETLTAAGGAIATALPQALHFLQTALAAGPRPARQLKAEALAHGLSLTTLNRAKEALGIDSELHCPEDGPRYWLWSLPAA